MNEEESQKIRALGWGLLGILACGLAMIFALFILIGACAVIIG